MSNHHRRAREGRGHRNLFATFPLFVSLLAASGCHSAYVDATVNNAGSSPISLVQVEYPSASFGTQTIAPGQEFHYRFKVLGSGPMKITYTDATHVEHKFTGPALKEGDDGTLAIEVGAAEPRWNLELASR
jgi:hypothetical protein